MSFLKLSSKIRAACSSAPPPVDETAAVEAAAIADEVDMLLHPTPPGPQVEPAAVNIDMSDEEEEEAKTSGSSKKKKKKKKSKRGPNKLSSIPDNPADRIVLCMSSDSAFIVDAVGVTCTQLPRDLTTLLKTHTEGWPTWSAWDPNYKKFVISEIKRRYQWKEPAKDSEYVAVVNSYAFRRYKDIVSKARLNAFRKVIRMEDWLASPGNVKKTKPEWCNDEKWARLVNHWLRPEWKNQSSQNQTNRRSENAVVSNRTGSRSMADLQKIMTEANDGQRVPYVDLVRRSKCRDAEGRCDPKTERTFRNYDVLMREKYGDDWLEKGVDDVPVWVKASGGIDHGNILGLRAVINKKKLPSSSAQPSPDLFSISQPYQSAVEEVRKQKEALDKEKEDWRKEQQAFIEQLRREKEEYKREREAWQNMYATSSATPMNPTAPMGPSQSQHGGFTSSVQEEWQNMYATAPPPRPPCPSGWTPQQPPWTPLWTNPAPEQPIQPRPGEPIRDDVAE